MASCEECWWEAQRRGVEYREQLAHAEQHDAPCTRNDEEGARLRAGQFWDEATKSDRRSPRSAMPLSTPQYGRME